MARDPFQRTGIDNQKKKKKKINQETKQAMTQKSEISWLPGERSLSAEIPRIEDQMK